MDTRRKIISSSDAARLAAEGAIVVSGYFDPLIASHAERLHELKRAPLIVAIENPPHPILEARARAELVASLTAVDYVVESPNGLAIDVRLESEDERRLKDLIAHVHARQQGAS
jgi:glycerol-3-phosphate cytidylyltransferase-like family protein